MLAAYRPLFAVPGAARFVAGATLSRIGGAMFGVAIIVMVSARESSYALAGAVSAVGVVVLAASSPVIGGLVDRWGQRRASLPFVLFAALDGTITILCSLLGAPVWTVFASYAASSCLPEMGPMSRARWAHIYSGDAGRLHTAMSFEQVVEEFAFVLGPVLAVAAATTLFPEAGLVLAYAVFTGGSLLFLAQRDTEPPIVPHADRPGGFAIHHPGVVVLALAGVMVGIIFGANEVVAVAISDEAGHKGFSAVILGAFAFASGVAGLVFGTRQFPWTLSRRMLVGAVAMCLLEAPALIAPNLWTIALVMLVAGSATVPVLITALTLLQRLVPRAQITEGMAVGVTGILVGISLGTSIAGWAVERLGAQEAYAVPVAAGVLAVAIVGVNFARLSRAEAAAPA